jgi:hypothetical protein
MLEKMISVGTGAVDTVEAACCQEVRVNSGTSVSGGMLKRRRRLLMAFRPSLVTIDMNPDMRREVLVDAKRKAAMRAWRNLLPSSQYVCLMSGGMRVVDVGLGQIGLRWYPVKGREL